MRWDDLRAVVLETNDSGPLGTDVFWLLVGRDDNSQCAVPQGATGEMELLAKLQELPGFDSEAVVVGMRSTRNQHFPCWELEL